MQPIVFIHGYSAEGKDNKAEQIYGSLPADLRRTFGRGGVLDLNLSRWISLSDGVALDDISFAMERALLQPKFRGLLDSGFHVVIHSTGALVVRNWIRLFERKPSPIANIVYLAGANFGSGLAHIGQGQLARWQKKIFQGTDRGLRVLDELELGAGKTLDMHRHFLTPGHSLYDDYEVQEFCANGSQTLGMLRAVPIRYVKEDSSDNTVRTSSCNLNYNLIAVTPSEKAKGISVSETKKQVGSRLAGEKVDKSWYDFDLSQLAASRQRIPFALLYETAHFGDDLGIVSGNKTRKQVLPLLVQALGTPHDRNLYDQVAQSWDAVSEATLTRVGGLKGSVTEWNKRSQYEGHSQLIFRIRDQYGMDVEHNDINFNSSQTKDRDRLEKMIEDKHVNRKNPGTTTYYLRTQKCVKARGGTSWVNLLDNVASLGFEVTGYEPQSGDIAYLPLTIALTPGQLKKLIEPFRTTVIDITLLRLPSAGVFELRKSS